MSNMNSISTHELNVREYRKPTGKTNIITMLVLQIANAIQQAEICNALLSVQEAEMARRIIHVATDGMAQ